jgi:hypothetical protein
MYPTPLNRLTNFVTFPQAFLAVFQIITLDGWTDIFEGISLSHPYCQTGVDCGNYWGAVIYCVTLIIIGRFLLMSLVLAAVFDSNLKAKHQLSDATTKALNKWSQLWRDADPEHTGFLPVKDFFFLLHSADMPFAWDLTKIAGSETVTRDNIMDFCYINKKFVRNLQMVARKPWKDQIFYNSRCLSF